MVKMEVVKTLSNGWEYYIISAERLERTADALLFFFNYQTSDQRRNHLDRNINILHFEGAEMWSMQTSDKHFLRDIF